jgi:hypothetical protein
LRGKWVIEGDLDPTHSARTEYIVSWQHLG